MNTAEHYLSVLRKALPVWSEMTEVERDEAMDGAVTLADLQVSSLLSIGIMTLEELRLGTITIGKLERDEANA